MAFDVLDEYEQGEVVRKWVRDNAVSMIVGVLLGLALIFGWQQWKAHQGRARADAAAQYASFDAAVSAGKPEDADKIATALRDKFADSPYAVFAAMRQADAASAKNDLASADKSLEWAVAHADSASLKSLVNLNLARLRLAQGKPDDAIALIEKLPQGAYPGMINELRGDALVRLKQPDAARTAYETALANIDPQSPERGIVQMKLDNQSVAAAPKAAAKPATSPVSKPADVPAPGADKSATEKQDS